MNYIADLIQEPMAIYRPIQISFWQKKFILKLTPESKYFYIYLLTNSKTSQCGIYELPVKVIELETGYNTETVTKLLNQFIDDNKIKYDFETEEVFILNWIKYNQISNENIKICVISEIKEIKNKMFVNNWLKLLDKFNNNKTFTDKLKQGLIRGLQDPTKYTTETEEPTETKTEAMPDFFESCLDDEFKNLSGFITAWQNWIIHLREKKSVTEMMMYAQITFLKQQLNPVECLNTATRNGWLNLRSVGVKEQIKKPMTTDDYHKAFGRTLKT